MVWWPAHGLEAVGDFEDLTDLPEWLLKLANGVSSDSGTSSHSGEAKIREGGRNDRLSREAYKLRKQGCSVEQIIEILRALNAQLCDPPLSDREVCVIGEGKASIPPDDGAECIFEGERSENPRGSTDSRGPTTDWPDPLDLADLADLARTEPDAPRMLIDDWLPCGYATLMAGHGGVGKSGIALHLAACIALGVPFFGLAVRQCRVLYLSCEDRTRVLHWRLHRICRHLGVTLDALAGQLHIIDLVGHDAVLWERDPRTGQTLTEAYCQLRKRVREHCIELLMVDGISDTYGGNENARTDVNRYVNALVGLVPEDTGAILLVGHINRPTASGMPTSEGYSGSTGWHNSVRARWFLHPETEHLEDGDRPERTGDLILELQKSNLGRIDQSMRFRWDDSAHLFIGQEIVGATKADRDHRDRTERRGIVNALRVCATHGINVPAATTGPRTAYHVPVSARRVPKKSYRQAQCVPFSAPY